MLCAGQFAGPAGKPNDPDLEPDSATPARESIGEDPLCYATYLEGASNLKAKPPQSLGSVLTSHPPPSALINSMFASSRRLMMSMSFRSFVRADVCQITT
jgi:hypothetical protein